jgi:hypothetical protein
LIKHRRYNTVEYYSERRIGGEFVDGSSSGVEDAEERLDRVLDGLRRHDRTDYQAYGTRLRG